MDLILYPFIVLTILLAVVFYIVLDEYRIYSFRKRIYSLSLKNSIKETVNKTVNKNTLENIREKLRRAGNPLSLTPETYILTRIGLFIFAIFYIFLVGMKGAQAVLFAVVAFFALDIYIYFEQKDREEAFRNEMPEIVDMFELGAAADVPMEDVFLIAAESAESKEVKKELAKLSAEYFITRDKEVCLKRFCKNVGLPEVNVLSMALLQGERTGRTLDILSSLSSSLFNTATAKIVRQDKMTDYKVLAAIFVLMASVVMLYMYPYFTNLEGGLKSIF